MDDTPTRTARLLQEIADELRSGAVSFPTHVEATLRIRRMVDDPDQGAEGLARAIVAEPLLAAKLIRLANSVAFHPGGPPVVDVRHAITRVGFAQVKTLAVAAAIEQLRQARGLGPLQETGRALWEHSVNVAALAYTLARKLTGLNPDEALYAGIVHDVGQFYLLAHVARYPELLDREADVSSLMYDLHKSVGHAVLQALDTPEEIIRAVDDHELLGSGPPQTLGDILFIANQMAQLRNPFSRIDEYSRGVLREAATFGWDRALVESVIAESAAEMQSMMAALKA